MRVLLLGGGGREHAIGWKLAASPHLDSLLAAPGNPGLAEVAEVVPEVAADDVAAVIRLAAERAVDLVVVGPEAPLAAGVADALAAERIAVFGPVAAAARLESSKAHAKRVMERAGVPTGRWAGATDAGAARARARPLRAALRGEGRRARRRQGGAGHRRPRRRRGMGRRDVSTAALGRPAERW